MARIVPRTYQRRLMVAMAVYVALLLLVYPQARTQSALALKTLYAVVPMLPMLYAIGLMAQRIRHSDELEQRRHLIALGVGAAVVSVVSLAGGFLAAAGVLAPGIAAGILLWIFPILMATYSAAQAVVARRYGGGLCDDEGEGLPLHRRFAIVAALICIVAASIWLRAGDAHAAGFVAGMAGGLAVTSALLAFLRWRRRQRPDA